MKCEMVELGTLITQAKTIRCKDGNYPVLSMTMHDGLVFQDDKFKKVIASKDRSEYKIVYRNQLVISFPIDEGVLAAQRITDAGIVSPAYGIWDIDQTKILPEFLEYALRCKRSINYYKAKLRGSTARRRSLPTPTLLAHTVPLPSIQEQKNILKIIQRAKTILEYKKHELQLLDDLIRARFVEMFGDNDKKIAISSLCDVSGGYSFKSGDISSKGSIKILQIGNVYLDDVNWETTNYLPERFDNTYSRFLLNEGDIVIALTRPIIQSLGNVKACLVKASDMPCLLNQRVGRIVSKKNADVSLKFIYGCLMTDDFTRYVESCCIGCSQPNISTKDIENYMIPDASYERQIDFVEFKEQVDKSKIVSETEYYIAIQKYIYTSINLANNKYIPL